MPKKDLVRDGRLQAPKKRTDRSYLKAAPATTPAAITKPEIDEAEDMGAEAPLADVEATAVAAAPAAPPTSPAPAAATSAATAAAAARHSGAARALEQQGVRKRRELDVDALARRDSEYAKHELRRIFIFASLVFAILVVITIFVA